MIKIGANSSSGSVSQGRSSFFVAAMWLIVAEFLIVCMAALVKRLSHELPLIEVVFWRNFIGLLVVMPITLFYSRVSLRTCHLRWHVIRSTCGLTAMSGFFYILGRMPLAEASLVKLTTPFFLPLVGALWLRERLSVQLVVPIVLGFVGVVFILRPGTATFQSAALIGLGAALLVSVAKVAIRRMKDTEPTERIVLYFAAFGTVVSFVPAVYSWVWPASMLVWFVILGVGVLGTLGQLAMTVAYKSAPPGRVGVYTYTSVVYAAALGWVFWGESLLWSTIVGGVLVVGAGVLMLSIDGRMRVEDDIA